MYIQPVCTHYVSLDLHILILKIENKILLKFLDHSEKTTTQ